MHVATNPKRKIITVLAKQNSNSNSNKTARTRTKTKTIAIIVEERSQIDHSKKHKTNLPSNNSHRIRHLQNLQNPLCFSRPIQADYLCQNFRHSRDTHISPNKTSCNTYDLDSHILNIIL